MITKNDCLTILVSLEDRGIDINSQMKKLLTAKEIPIDVLKFILTNRGIEVANFYEMLRKKHNQKKPHLPAPIRFCSSCAVCTSCGRGYNYF
jgi:hypothetical protein